MTDIRTGFAPRALVNTPSTQSTPSTDAPAAAPQGWEKFQDNFYAAPASQIDVLRQRANELGKPEVVAPLNGLQLSDGPDAARFASNAMRNYPVKEIYSELYTETAPAQASGFEGFKTAFYAAPASQLDVLRARANELGKPEIMDAFKGLNLADGPNAYRSAGNALMNYPFEQAYNALYGA